MTQVRGRLTGPRCPYTTTVEVAYPFREHSRDYGEGGSPRLTLRAIIPEPSWWDPQTPFLYEGPVELWQDGRLVDVSLSVSPIVDRAGRIVGGQEDAADHRLHSQSRKDIMGHIQCVYPFRLIEAAHVDVSVSIGLRVNADLLEGPILFSKNKVILGCHAPQRWVQRNWADLYANELFRMWVGERFQDNTVHNSKNRGRRADTECESQNGDKSECG